MAMVKFKLAAAASNGDCFCGDAFVDMTPANKTSCTAKCTAWFEDGQMRTITANHYCGGAPGVYSVASLASQSSSVTEFIRPHSLAIDNEHRSIR